MNPSGGKHARRAKRRLEETLADSAQLLTDVISDVDLQVRGNEYWTFELGRLLHDREPSFEDREFRLLIEQGIRLHVNPDLSIRSNLAERLRQAYPELKASGQAVAKDVIGAVEDSSFPLEQVGAIVRNYTRQLFELLEKAPDTSATETSAREWLQKWREGSIPRSDLLLRLRRLGPEAVPSVADTLFESVDDANVVDLALEVLSALESHLAARVLADLVSEPILEEHHEDRALSILREFWPSPRSYIYYKLRQHSHEDIPFRWLELLIDMDDTRGVDRILEEIVVHGHLANYNEDLRAALGLLDRTNDPGVIGKLLRLITEESLSKESLRLVEEWIEPLPLAGQLERALDGWNNGTIGLIPQMTDFSSFASNYAEKSAEELRDFWNAAYHESLGWLQFSQLPRGPLESEFNRQFDEAKIQQLSVNPRPEETALRDNIESFGEDWLVTLHGNVVGLVGICLERRRDTPWLEEIYWNEINNWYVRAAQLFDEGDRDRARQYLEIILTVEPDYPLARMLHTQIVG